ncbi:MAG: HAMP domain-containing protein [Gammaproteobacteria bacterium]|nr:HAMP domain-containing protein [Gammaproteobacteria bacterium]
MNDTDQQLNTLTRLGPDMDANPDVNVDASPEQAALFPPPGRWQRLYSRLGARLQRFAPSHIPIVYKITLSISVLMVACIGLLATVIVQNQNQVVRDQIDDLGNTLATQIAHSALEPLLADDRLALGVLATNLTAEGNVLGTAILSSKGEILAEAGLTPFQPDAPYAGEQTGIDARNLRGLEWTVTAKHTNRMRNLVAYTSSVRFQDVIAGHVVVTLSRSSLDQSLRGATQSILFASLLVVVIGGILTVFLGRRLSKPIHDLMHASRALDAGHYHFRFAERRNDEIGNLMTSFNRYAEGMERSTHMESTLARYLSPSVAREITTGGSAQQLGGQRVEATVLFADIVGFTGMAEGMNPEEVANLLNRYFAHIVRACEMNEGMVDKYIGDCVMLVFGVPQSDPEHSFHGIMCALTIQRLVAMENQARERQGMAPVRFRLGLNSGEMLAGNMGAQERMEYTVVGDTVNLASRLGSAAEAGQIILTEQIYNRPEITERFVARPHRSIRLRGIQHPVTTYVVEDVKPEYKEGFERQIQQLWWQGHRRTA